MWSVLYNLLSVGIDFLNVLHALRRAVESTLKVDAFGLLSRLTCWKVESTKSRKRDGAT